ncbi:hypothetical protein [Nocardioides taihuensis]|uniref:FAD synthase n=1 Tax=Nocardioides taihuensis TaxID=1835606 RepID=A0ABW0BEF5_9ACTN
MIAIISLDRVRPRERRVAAGFFDGIHIGHRSTIKGCDTVLTFDPHPRAVVGTAVAPKHLSTLAHRAEILESLGVRELVVIDFNKSRSRQTPDAFTQEVFVDALRATHVHVGASFRFGFKAAGTPESLAADGRFAVRVARTVSVDGEVVSSTRIRELIERGDVSRAASLLGSFPEVVATIAPGERCQATTRTAVRLSTSSCLPVPGRYGCVVNGVAGVLTIPEAERLVGGATIDHPVSLPAGALIRIQLTSGSGVSQRPAPPVVLPAEFCHGPGRQSCS